MQIRLPSFCGSRDVFHFFVNIFTCIKDNFNHPQMAVVNSEKEVPNKKQFADEVKMYYGPSSVLLILFFVILTTAFILLPSQIHAHRATVTQARAYVYKSVQSPDQDSLVPIGVVDFTAIPGGHVAVNGTLRGLTPGAHGFHVHQNGELAQLCVAAGPHFNPHGRTHGAPQNDERHVGDLGNVQANENGVAEVHLQDSLLSLGGQNSILGRGLVVHEKVDDLGQGGNEESKKTGNAGKRVGCGVIGVKAEAAAGH